VSDAAPLDPAMGAVAWSDESCPLCGKHRVGQRVASEAFWVWHLMECAIWAERPGGPADPQATTWAVGPVPRQVSLQSAAAWNVLNRIAHRNRGTNLADLLGLRGAP
jgi:hypothetical protein